MSPRTSSKKPGFENGKGASMKYGIALTLALATLAGCSTSTQDRVETGRDSQEILSSFQRQIHQQQLLADGTRGKEDVEQLLLAASRVAQQRLLPDRQLLMARAQRELAELPEPDLRSPGSRWAGEKTIYESTISQLVSGLMEEWELDEDEKPSRDAILYAMSFWSPRAAALAVRNHVLQEVLSLDAYGQRSMMQSFAPPVFWAVERDPKRPVIAVDMGPEVCIVHLERTSQGAYVDTRTEIMRQTWQTSDSGKPSGK